MLGKLLKHELRATGRTMLPILGVMLIVSAITNVGARLMSDRELPRALNMILVLVSVVFVVGFMAMGLVTVFMMVRRFRDNLLRDEGYIMHTLPVSVHAQVWSKVIASALWYAVTAVTEVLAVFIVDFDVDTVKAIGDFLGSVFEAITRENYLFEMIVEVLAVLVLASVVMSLSFDAALSIGHAFAKHKMALSVAAFILIILVFNALSLTGAEFMMFPDSTGQSAEFMTYWRRTCALISFMMLWRGAVCYAITVIFLKRRLNLE